MNKIKELQATVSYHCAAYTTVDKVDDEGKDLDEKSISTVPKNDVTATETVGATLIYISTNYVLLKQKGSSIWDKKISQFAE